MRVASRALRTLTNVWRWPVVSAVCAYHCVFVYVYVCAWAHFLCIIYDSDCLYFCGNSLGLQPKITRSVVNEELDEWAERGVEGHFRAKRPWLTADDFVREGASGVWLVVAEGEANDGFIMRAATMSVMSAP